MESSPTADDYSTISAEEWLLRWILAWRKHYRRNQDPPILEEAFLPRKQDKDGLSLSRRKSLRFPSFPDEWDFKSNNRHPHQNLQSTCGVCAVLVQSAQSLGLSIRYDPIIDPDTGEIADPSHILIPEINYGDFEGENSTEQSRGQIRLWISQLVRLASQNLLIPPGKLMSDRPVQTESESP